MIEYITNMDVRRYESDLTKALNPLDRLYDINDIKDMMTSLLLLHINNAACHTWFERYKINDLKVRQAVAYVYLRLRDEVNEIVPPERFLLLGAWYRPFSEIVYLKYSSKSRDTDFFRWVEERSVDWPLDLHTQRLLNEYHNRRG